MPEYKFVTYEELDEGKIARITLNRVEARNAQNRGLLVELDDAFFEAEKDDQVRVVILAGAGPLFSSGHDLGSKDAVAEHTPGRRPSHQSYATNGGTRKGAEARMLQEWHYFFQNTLRWRNLRKITVAQVQGSVYAAGLMLMWAATLSWPPTTPFLPTWSAPGSGCAGWSTSPIRGSSGPGKAKELLLTGDSIDAEEAHAWAWCQRSSRWTICPSARSSSPGASPALPSMTSLMIKESVNQSVDNMGFYNALQACFTLHQLNHSHWAEVNEDGYPAGKPEQGVPDWKTAPPVVPAVKDLVRSPDPVG